MRVYFCEPPTEPKLCALGGTEQDGGGQRGCRPKTVRMGVNQMWGGACKPEALDSHRLRIWGPVY